jgi:hypothetical protein
MGAGVCMGRMTLNVALRLAVRDLTTTESGMTTCVSTFLSPMSGRGSPSTCCRYALTRWMSCAVAPAQVGVDSCGPARWASVAGPPGWMGTTKSWLLCTMFSGIICCGFEEDTDVMEAMDGAMEAMEAAEGS